MQNLQSFDKNRQFYPNWMFKYKIAPIFLYRKSVLSRYTYVHWTKQTLQSIVCRLFLFSSNALTFLLLLFLFLLFLSRYQFKSLKRQQQFNEVPHQVVYLRRWCSFHSVLSFWLSFPMNVYARRKCKRIRKSWMQSALCDLASYHGI